MRLNNTQLQAVESMTGPVLIVAGPGTGKTKTLTARIAHLIASGTAKPGEILALTFTNKAAEEMRARVAASVDGKLPTITTFHGYAINYWAAICSSSVIWSGQCLSKAYENQPS